MRGVVARAGWVRSVLMAGLLLAACTREPLPPGASPPAGPVGGPVAPAAASPSTSTPGVAARAPAASAGPLVVFLGDSLSAGLGLAEEEAFPARVGEELARRGVPVRVINGGVSGDTTAGGRERLDWLLDQRPDWVIVELGANDGLRGQPIEGIEANLRDIVLRSRAAGAQVVLAGMRMPPSHGREYAEAFAAIWPRLAAELDVPLLPFLLDGVAGHSELNLPDGFHPNPEGHRRVAATVADFLAPLVRKSDEPVAPVR